MLFNPKLVYESEDSLKTQQRFTLYRNWDEYIICALHERDAFLNAGYSENPRDFISKEIDDATRLREDIASITQNKSNIEAPKKIRLKKKFVEATEQEVIENAVTEMS